MTEHSLVLTPHVKENLSDLDVAAKVVASAPELDKPLSAEESEMIRRKIDLHLLPLMMATYLVQFLDKSTLGTIMILGLQKDTKLSAGQYNWLGTIFFVSFLLFEYPQNLALQRYPVGKWLAFNVLAWALVIYGHIWCKNFLQLFFCRFLLGACEGCAAAGFMIATSMFYTHEEQGFRIGCWFLTSGISVIFGSIIGYSIIEYGEDAIAPWKLFMLIIGSMTSLVAIFLWFFFPDSPANARFLTKEEKVKAVLRIKVNQTGVENKHFKKHQAMEALKDGKTWAWFLYALLAGIPNISQQQSLIIKSIGYTRKETMLLTIVIGVVMSLSILIGVVLVRSFRNSRAYVSVGMSFVNICGGILSLALPWSERVGLLTAIYLNLFSSAGYVIAIGWITSTSAGHTKRITTQAIVFIGNCCGNIIAPQLWQPQYKPRYLVPWGIITCSYVASSAILMSMRFYLAHQNEIREKRAMRKPKSIKLLSDVQPSMSELHETEECAVDLEPAVGPRTRGVDKAFMDLTDLENEEFRYVL